MLSPEKTTYCWGCGAENRRLQLFLNSWLCQACINHLKPIAASEAEEREDDKTKPCVSTDCRSDDHAACEGEESALWPDGTFSMRPCSCSCHT